MGVARMIFTTFIDLIQVSVVMSRFFNFSFLFKKNRIILFNVIAVFEMTIAQLSHNEGLYSTTGIILCSIFVYIMFEQGTHNRLMCMVMIYLIGSAIDTFCWYMIKCIKIYDKNDSVQETLAYIIATVIIMIFIITYSRINKVEFNTYSHRSITFFICCTMILGIVTFTFPMLEENCNFENGFLGVLFLMTMILIMLISICAMYFATKNDEYKVKEEISNTKVELLNNYYNELIKNNEDIRKFQHDYKNHIRSIKYLVNVKNYDKLIKYLEEIENSPIIQTKIVDVNNEIVSAILSDYKVKFEKENIKMQVRGKIPKESNVTDMDWCTIFSNCLQNSLEAIRNKSKHSDNIVNISIKEQEKRLLILIENSLNEIPEIKNNEMRTTKKDKNSHGIGIKNVKKSIEKYHGSLSYYVNEQQKRITTSIFMILD